MKRRPKGVSVVIIHAFVYSVSLEVNNTATSFEDFSSFFAPLNPQASNSSESTLTRLQNLADSLPTQIYDKNGNLIPLNTSQPPMSFFEIDTPVVATTSANTITRTVPIFHRENVDWSTVTLTSILKKIVPEEAFIEQPTDAAESLDMIETNVNIMDALDTKDHVQEQFQCVFNQVELKLLDRDQLTAIAKHFNISSDQSDYKIEHELLTNVFKSASKRNAAKNSVSKEKISWTEENEGLLLKIYEELRAEKHKVDQKLLQLLSNNNAPASNTSSTPSLKRGHGASDRGLWAVLTDQFRQTAKFHVSVSECRNKLIILKRLKTH